MEEVPLITLAGRGITYGELLVALSACLMKLGELREDVQDTAQGREGVAQLQSVCRKFQAVIGIPDDVFSEFVEYTQGSGAGPFIRGLLEEMEA